MFIADSHIHNHYSSDGKGTVDEFCQEAISKGLNCLCFTNHAEKVNPENNQPEIHLDEFFSLYEKEKEEIAKAKTKYPSLVLNHGVEFENRSSFKNKINTIIEKCEFDIILGSLHVIKDVSISNKNSRNFLETQEEEHVYNLYFDEMLNLLEEMEMDVLAHFDIIKRYGNECFTKFNPTKYAKKIDAVIEVIKTKNIALEINTSGLFQSPKETYPGIDIIKKAVDAGIDLTIGSDAHSPANVGKGIIDIYKNLKEQNISQICTFTKREKQYIEL